MIALRCLWTPNSKSYSAFKFFSRGYSFIKMSQNEAVLSKSRMPIYLATKIPNVDKCLSKALPGARIENVCLCNENEEIKLDIKALGKAEIMLCDGEILSNCLPHVVNLKWAHCTWAGVEGIISAVKTSGMQPQFVLTRHRTEAFASLMAEYVICQIINWERNMRDLWKNQEQKIWSGDVKYSAYRPLSKLVIAILGVGNMGCSIATYLKKFGAVVMGLSRSPKNMSEYPSFDSISTNMDEVLSQCDYLCNTLPSTEDTFHLLDGDILSKCLKKPVFINVGRGNIIQENYLVHALRNEWVSGAVLDVFEKEPLPKSSILWTMPQVVITPHVSCVSLAEHIVDGFLSNYKLYLSGENLKHTVNWNIGY